MNNQKKILKGPLQISIAILLIGGFFKMMHWPYSFMIIISSLILISILYPYRFLKKTPKRPIDYVKLVLVEFYLIQFAFGILHWLYREVFQIGTTVLFVIWLGMEIYNLVTNQMESNTIKSFLQLSKISHFLAAILIVVGSLCKIIHYPYADEILIVGFLTGVISVLKNTFKKKKMQI